MALFDFDLKKLFSDSEVAKKSGPGMLFLWVLAIGVFWLLISQVDKIFELFDTLTFFDEYPNSHRVVCHQ